MINMNVVSGKVHNFFALVFIVFFIFTGCKKDNTQPAPDEKYTITIDPTITYQIIRGIGGATVFVPAGGLPTPSELDILFGNDAGQIGLSILRIRLASDEDPSWRATELAHALKAKSHGAIVIATPWSPPARMKSNKNLNQGSLLVDSFPNYAKYLNNFANYMAQNGAALYAVSVQNEPDVKVTYESCDWTAISMRDFLKNNGNLITSTKVIAPESFNFNQTFTDVILNDAGAAAHVDIVGGHIYGGGLTDYANARNKAKELWMTEHYTNTDDANIWSSAIGVAKEIHDCMVTGQYSAYIWWYLKRFYGPLGENGVVTKRGWVMANFAKFVRPGYYRTTVEGLVRSNIFISAYTGDKLIIVALNLGTSEISQKFVLKNSSAMNAIPYTTSETKNLEAGSTINITDNLFDYNLPARSITTFVIE
jgi:glucuronoarabinoxylan endo-1,4-beta-xylanase